MVEKKLMIWVKLTSNILNSLCQFDSYEKWSCHFESYEQWEIMKNVHIVLIGMKISKKKDSSTICVCKFQKQDHVSDDKVLFKCCDVPS